MKIAEFHFKYFIEKHKQNSYLLGLRYSAKSVEAKIKSKPVRQKENM